MGIEAIRDRRVVVKAQLVDLGRGFLQNLVDVGHACVWRGHILGTCDRVTGSFPEFIFIQYAPFDTGVFNANVRAGEIIERL